MVFERLYLLDNCVAGFEVEMDGNTEAGVGYLDKAVIVGKTTANGDNFEECAPHGAIMPRTERYTIKNVQFANFNFTGQVCEDTNDPECNQEAAALGSCSKCYSDRKDATDSDARTTFFENIMYNGDGVNKDVTRAIRYGYPYKAIFENHDCTL